MLVKLALPPGVMAHGSRYQAANRWADCNMVRFHQGSPEKIGGWEKITSSATDGTPRALIEWVTLDGYSYIGIGTTTRYYLSEGGALYDITPVRRTITLTGPPTVFSVTDGSSTLTITDADHGAVVGDTVIISSFGSLAGVTIDGTYTVVSTADADTLTVTMTGNANTTTTSNGPATFTYLINVGLDSSVDGSGWGAGTWGGLVDGSTGDTGWGESPSIEGSTNTLRLWSHDTFGQDLIINPRNGAIYYWTASTGTGQRATLVSAIAGATEVPDVATEIIVSDQDRRLIAFGCTDWFTGEQDPLLIRWSDTEAPQVMMPSDLNSAGDLRIPIGAKFITAVQTRQEILVWSDAALHSLAFIGPPLIYGIQPIGTTSIIAPNAKAAANDVVYWMGGGSFYRYDGRITPMICTVQDKVFANINLAQSQKICAGVNSAYHEVWWFYPSADSEENDSYVIYNYVQDAWYFGTMARTAWLDRGFSTFPRAASPDGYVYCHEDGTDDGSTTPASAITAYIESGPIELGEGDRFLFLHRMIPDVSFRETVDTTPSVTMTLTAQDFPGVAQSNPVSGTVTRSVSGTVEQFTEQLHLRLRSRSVALKVQSDDAGVFWRLGVPRIDVRPDGRR